MAAIHEKITKIYKAQGMTTRQAASVCGFKYTTFRSMLNDEREVSASTLDAFSQAFNVPFGFFSDRIPTIKVERDPKDGPTQEAISNKATSAFHLAGLRAAKAGEKVTLQSFLNWWVSNSGRLENFDQIADRVDLFEKPSQEDNQIRPLQIGGASLATKYFYLEETAHLNQTLDGFSPETNAALVQAHIEACNRGEPVITHPFLNETLRNGDRFERRYRRVMAPLYLGGKTLLANYSEDIF